jgi:Flp pilus assembly protein TadB
MTEDRPPSGSTREMSDLVGIELTLALAVWFIATLACFFFVGAVVGVIVLVAGVLVFGWALVSAVRRAEIHD